MSLYFFSRIHNKNRLRWWLLLSLVLSVLVAGCGQSGPLKLPDDDKKEEAAK